jgi:hypothetical protein
MKQISARASATASRYRRQQVPLFEILSQPRQLEDLTVLQPGRHADAKGRHADDGWSLRRTLGHGISGGHRGV